MTEREFIFWLRGYVGASLTLNKTQLKLIKHRLYYLKDDKGKPLDNAILGQEAEFEEEIELYKTYGGD